MKRPPGDEGFAVIRRCWVVGRTFAWVMKRRSLVRDDEQLAAIAIFVRRAA
ncbi:MAG: hypothetical protein ACFCUS_01875 [Rubrimonas sp.]|uniref:hypothetical protein n=1 Tax=Rubrimonas sp. TaxID=2036015 RepID=UPI002FDE5DE0